MKYIFYALSSFVIFISCSDDEKAIDVVLNDVTRGAALRTIERISSNFLHEDYDSDFEILVEDLSTTPGNDLDFLRLYLKYIDREADGLGEITSEVIFRDISANDFFIGSDGEPQINIKFSYQEAIDALGLDADLLQPGDQFELRAENFLTNGNAFSNDSASASILTDFCFFKSPYRYIINIIRPIEQDMFTGNYSYEVLNDLEVEEEFQFLGLGAQGLTSISSGLSPNIRNVGLFFENLEITISGNFIYPKIYQTVSGLCRDSELIYLSGPANSAFGSYDPLDDTVFEMDIVLDTEGPSPRQVRYRFTKQ